MNAHPHPPSCPPEAAPAVLLRGAAPPNRRRQVVLGLGALWVAGALSGCGFALRQPPSFGFKALFVTTNITTAASKALQRELAASGIQVATGAPAPDTADAVVLNVVVDQGERVVVGQTANGEVRELELRYRFRYSLSTPSGRRLIEEQELLLERNISFSETAVLAKAAEEQVMFTDMRGDVVQQVMRRLAAVRVL